MTWPTTLAAFSSLVRARDAPATVALPSISALTPLLDPMVSTEANLRPVLASKTLTAPACIMPTPMVEDPLYESVSSIPPAGAATTNRAIAMLAESLCMSSLPKGALSHGLRDSRVTIVHRFFFSSDHLHPVPRAQPLTSASDS